MGPLNKYLILQSMPVGEALKKIVSNKSGIVFVVDDYRRLIGALTDGDFRVWILNNPPNLSIQVAEICNKKPFFVHQYEHSLKEIAADVKFIPVLNKLNQVIDIIELDIKRIQIGSNIVSVENKALLIAEIGNNHNGSLDMAYRLIDQAKLSGADVVKFQMRILQSMNRDNPTGAEDVGVEYINSLLERFNLKIDDLIKCFEYSRQIGLDVACTPFDLDSLKVLAEYQVDAIKIASADLTNHPLLVEAANTHIPLIVSTGMSTQDELDVAAQVLLECYAKFIPLHCNSTYPAPFKDVNLSYMPTLGRLTSHGLFGYSGHERGIAVPMAAIALGAKIIEKHFTLDKTLEGNDHRVSLLPDEFGEMVKSIRDVESSMGTNSIKKITQGEMINRENLAKSIVASRKLYAGEILTNDMLDFRAPGRGIQPDKRDKIIGHKINRDIDRHEFIFFSDITDAVLHEKQYSFKRPFGIPVRFHDVNQIIAGSNINLIEFHLTYGDLDIPIDNLRIHTPMKKIVVHAPELFGSDHILDLASRNNEYLNQSIGYLKKVVEVTENLKKVLGTKEKIQIVVNVGGFTEDGFLPQSNREELYERVEQSLCLLETNNIEFIVQTMPPYPWHFGGQRFHNLFVDPAEIARYCERYKRRICLDVSHTAMATTFLQSALVDACATLSRYTAHLHISDAQGLDGEGLQIGSGEIDFKEIAKVINQGCPDASIIPEIWQGHKNSGTEFYTALDYLESYGF